MFTGIDHVVVAAPDPDAAAAALEASLGLRFDAGGRHASLGTRNRLAWFGDSYLELIGVVERSLAERSWIGVPTLAALDRGGGLATFALATDDLAGTAERLRSAGSSLGAPIEGSRERPDGRAVRWTLAAPPWLAPDEPPFLIAHDASAAEWTPAERTARAAEVHPAGGPVRLVRLEIPLADVHRATTRYVRTLGITFRPSLAGGGARDATVGEQTIRLRRIPLAAGSSAVPAPTIVLHLVGGATAAPGAEPVVVDLLGCRFVLQRR